MSVSRTHRRPQFQTLLSGQGGHASAVSPLSGTAAFVTSAAPGAAGAGAPRLRSGAFARWRSMGAGAQSRLATASGQNSGTSTDLGRAIGGVWLLQQDDSPNGTTSYLTTFRNGFNNVPSTIGMGMRYRTNTVVNAAGNLNVAAGSRINQFADWCQTIRTERNADIKFSLRPLFGQYLPAAWATEMTNAGGGLLYSTNVPHPCYTQAVASHTHVGNLTPHSHAVGDPNDVMIALVRRHYQELMAWRTSRGIGAWFVFMHGAYFGHDYSEYYNGPETQQSQGAVYTQAQHRAAHIALVDAICDEIPADVVTEFATTGHGPMVGNWHLGTGGGNTFVEDICDYLVDRFGSGSDRVVISQNGWSPTTIAGGDAPSGSEWNKQYATRHRPGRHGELRVELQDIAAGQQWNWSTVAEWAVGGANDPATLPAWNNNLPARRTLGKAHSATGQDTYLLNGAFPCEIYLFRAQTSDPNFATIEPFAAAMRAHILSITGNTNPVVDLAEMSRGTWALFQTNSLSQISSAQTTAALNFDGIRGYAPRFPWNAIADADGHLTTAGLGLLNTARAKADTHGVEMSMRFMAGRYLPAQLFDAMGPNYYYTLTEQDPGARIPKPFSSSGTVGNPVFEAAYTTLVQELAAWCRANRVYLFHHAWYGRLWAEYNAAEDIQLAAGWSTQGCTDGNNRLMDIAETITGTDLAVSFTSSGHFANGLTNTITAAIRNRMIALWGANNPQIQTLLTGLGEFQAPNSTLVSNINPGGTQNIYDGEQMFDGALANSSGTPYNWANLFQSCFNSGINWVEVYTPSFSQGTGVTSPAALQTAINKFNTDWGIDLGGNPPPNPPGVPTVGTVTTSGGNAVVPFTASASGGTATSFEVVASPGGATVTGTTSPITHTGPFTAGQAYTFQVRALNADGTSALSAASNSVTPVAVTPTPPGTPTIGTVTTSGGNAIVPFTPSATGGAATSFAAVASPGSATINGTSSPITHTGPFTAGQAYTFQVRASNAGGTSGLSAASNSVTPVSSGGGSTVPTGGYTLGQMTFTVPGSSPARTCYVYYPATNGSSASGTPVMNATPNRTRTFAVIEVGHGQGGNGTLSANLHRFLVAAGYIVVAPSFLADLNMTTASNNAKACLDTVLGWNTTTGHLLQGTMDATKIGWSGTSMGGMIGYTMGWHNTLNDPRIRAYHVRATFAPGSSGSYTWTRGHPILHIHGNADEVISYSTGRNSYLNVTVSPRGFIGFGDNPPAPANGTPHNGNHALQGIGTLSTEGPLGFFAHFLYDGTAAQGLNRIQNAVNANSLVRLYEHTW